MLAHDRLRELLEALALENVEYVLVGGQAMNLHGILRFTEDIDLFVVTTEDNISRLKRAFKRIWDDQSIDEINAADLAGEYPVVRYGTPDGFYIDVMSRLGEAVAYDDITVEPLKLGDTTARIATPDALYRMKKDTVRPIDRADALDLKAKFKLDE